MNDCRATMLIEPRTSPTRFVATALVAVALTAQAPTLPALAPYMPPPTAVVCRLQPQSIVSSRGLSPAYVRSLRERYARIAKAQWFRDAYENRSVGEILLIA